MNTILIVLIVVVIYLIHTTSPKKEAFGINPHEDGYTNNNYWDPYGTECNQVNTIDDCQNRYWGSVCRDKCESIQNQNQINNNYWDPYRTECNQVNTIDDCQNRYLGSVCRDKCESIKNQNKINENQYKIKIK